MNRRKTCKHGKAVGGEPFIEKAELLLQRVLKKKKPGPEALVVNR